MKKNKNITWVILFLIFLISCGPSEEEIQARIDKAVEQATSTTSSTTTSTSTTSTVTTIKLSDSLKSELELRYTRDFSEIYDNNWAALFNLEIVEIHPDGYWIYTEIEGDNLFKIFIHYSNGCSFETSADLKRLYPNEECEVKKYTEAGFEQNVYLNNIQLVSNSKNSVTGKNINILLKNDKKNITLPNGRTICCHKFNFQTFENSFLEYFKNYYKDAPTTTTTLPPTTTTTLPPTTTTTLPPTTTTTVDYEKQICSNFLESFRIVSNGVKDTGQLESDILNSLAQNKISWESAYELQLEVVDFYSEWSDTWNNTYPNNNNIEFWNNYVEIYRLRVLSAISLAQYYYYYDEAYFRESNDYLGQAQSISANTTFNSC